MTDVVAPFLIFRY